MLPPWWLTLFSHFFLPRQPVYSPAFRHHCQHLPSRPHSSMTQTYESWGRYPRRRQHPRRAHWSDQIAFGARALLPFGNGRSYGDSCLNSTGELLDIRSLDRFIHFDTGRGRLRCEAGVLLAEILQLIVPRGWFLPVTPGTRFVTVGGAIANDVHGKNHHQAGTFGRHVRRLELLRSDGSRRLCSAEENPQWFAATVGGLGLTGVILWAELQLQPVANAWISQEVIRFPDLAAFFALSAASQRDYQYSVAWVDCLARGAQLGRGLFIRGNHAPALPARRPPPPRLRLDVPLAPPVSLINRLSLRLFNTVYFHVRPSRQRGISHYQPFFYPLDSVLRWNRIYGPRGFLQYQCVVPIDDGHAAIQAILRRISDAGQGSFLAVLKVFGDLPSPGMLSFPRPGVTLALDFPFHGEATLDLLAALDRIVVQVGGAVYPAKDARMSGAHFQRFFPLWETFRDYRDPRLNSDFWRRVNEESHA